MRSGVAFVIMAGGRGQRLWPLVRESLPKACVCFDGRRTLLETTLMRLRPFMQNSKLLIVTTAPQANAVRRLLAPRSRRSLLIEPQIKNTAACIGLAAATLSKKNPSLVMVALPADHWIRNLRAFRRSLLAAIETAQEEERIVTIGLLPRHVSCELGYLRTGPLVGFRHGCRVFRMRQFVEKPALRVAQRLLRKKRTYWNTGIFVGRVSAFLKCINRWLPGHARFLFPLGELAGCAGFAKRSAWAYRRLSAISFDHGVMAHLREGCVVEGCFDWEDLGTWESWVRAGRKAKSVLTLAGRNVRVISLDGTSRVHAGHLVATIGLKDAIIVRVPDATLICRTHKAQAVRDLAERLAQDRRLCRFA